MKDKVIILKTKSSNLVKNIKSKLESQNLFNKSEKITKDNNDNFFIIPTLSHDIEELKELLQELNDDVLIVEHEMKNKGVDSKDITNFIRAFLKKNKTNIELSDILLSKIPKKWTIYPPMLLINNHDTFESQEWQKYLSTVESNSFFLELLSTCFKNQNVSHIAVNKPIVEQDIMRRPFNLVPIFNDFGPVPTKRSFDYPTERDFKDAFWCTVVQNGIFQTWAPRYTMFSRGNIKEKTRILNTFTDVKGNSIVDLYAGIGYFTLSYLKLNAKHLFCFELNPWSIEGLKRGAKQNGYKYLVIHRDEEFKYDPSVNVFIFQESNEYAIKRFQMAKIQLPISHINLGILPTSVNAWPIALTLYKNYSTAQKCELHIHQNVATSALIDFLEKTYFKLLKLENVLIEPLHLEKIKSFAPDVWHICADFRVFKQ